MRYLTFAIRFVSTKYGSTQTVVRPFSHNQATLAVACRCATLMVVASRQDLYELTSIQKSHKKRLRNWLGSLMPDPRDASVKYFLHRLGPFRMYLSTCLTCYQIVAKDLRESNLIDGEEQHKCKGPVFSSKCPSLQLSSGQN
jgi:hypothetical protein